tara:strand:- start:310 stop:1143 length:834 start_codon:yes stop_codon:yes gene_type:complete
MLRLFISKLKIFRYPVLSIIKFFDREISIKHHISNKPFHLELYGHKGYWFFGRSRENYEIKLIQKLIKKDFKILEIGAHIGYLTVIFESILSSDNLPNIVACEPSPKTINLLKKNIKSTTIIHDKAMTNQVGKTISFYTENHGGSTNSTIKRFTQDSLKYMSKSSHRVSEEIEEITVVTDTVDNFCRVNSFNPDFIKIDVEGAELSVLEGSLEQLKKVKVIMLEASQNQKQIYDLLIANDFRVFTPKMKEITNYEGIEWTIFCFSNLHLESLMRSLS